MGREQRRIEGRDGLLDALWTAGRSGARRGRLVVLRGPAGIGKTGLLAESGRRWRARGVPVVEVRAGGRADLDRYGIGAVVDAFREDFDLFSDSGLIDEIGALVRLRRRAPDDPSMRFPAVVAELSRLFARIGGPGPAAVLVDDVLRIADPTALVLAARRPGCLVVVTVRAETEPSRAAAELLEAADDVLEVGPLTPGDVTALAGGDLDDVTHRALRVALGPLYGNPGTVLATLEALRAAGRLVTTGRGSTLAHPPAPIALPHGHHLLRRLGPLGDLAPRLLAVAGSRGALDVDDLPSVAEALGQDLDECGRMVDLLVEEGLLVADTGGRLRCACPALAAAISAEAASPAPVAAHHGLSPVPVARARAWSAAEERIVELICRGHTNRQIGSELGMSEKTVESHLTRLFAKSGCRSRVGLVAKANQEGRWWTGAGVAFREPAA
jgi:DNA-binding CsgD family transcriptional regulator